MRKGLRFDIFRRDAFTCRYCGAKPPEVILEIDHVVPRSEGGSDDPINLVTACWGCNRGKAAKRLDLTAPPQPDADLEYLVAPKVASGYLSSYKWPRYMWAVARNIAGGD